MKRRQDYKGIANQPASNVLYSLKTWSGLASQVLVSFSALYYDAFKFKYFYISLEIFVYKIQLPLKNYHLIYIMDILFARLPANCIIYDFYVTSSSPPW